MMLAGWVLMDEGSALSGCRLPRKLVALALAVTLACAAVPALARVPARGRINPLTKIVGLLHPKAERVVRLAQARVVLADYPLIRHDFARPLQDHYRKALSQISEQEIDTWLLDATAYVSAAQTRQIAVNTQIPTTSHTSIAYRPQDYGRALVFRAAKDVLIDVKGSGAVAPGQGDHSNGLATLGEAVREYAYEHLVNRLFLHSGTGQRTVGHYAVIDAGFDVKFADGRQDRAGLILRQAHSRASGDKSSLRVRPALKIEKILRRYGVTSAGAYQEAPYDALNIQGTRGGALLDFGGFLAMKSFSKPAYHFDHTPDIEPGRKPMMEPGGEWVQPNERRRVPFDVWGYTRLGRADPIADNPWVWSHELGSALATGHAQRKHAELHFQTLMDAVEQQLKN